MPPNTYWNALSLLLGHRGKIMIPAIERDFQWSFWLPASAVSFLARMGGKVRTGKSNSEGYSPVSWAILAKKGCHLNRSNTEYCEPGRRGHSWCHWATIPFGIQRQSPWISSIPATFGLAGFSPKSMSQLNPWHTDGLFFPERQQTGCTSGARLSGRLWA